MLPLCKQMMTPFAVRPQLVSAQVTGYVGAAAVDVRHRRRSVDFTVVVTCTVAASTAAPTPRVAGSQPSLERTRTMQSTGRDGSVRVTLIVTDAVSWSIT